MSAPRILSIGAATQDVFLHGKVFQPHRDKGKNVEEFAYGSKNEVEGIYFTTGGGATNAAVTFARHGFRSAYLGRLGEDPAATSVLEDLHKEGVNSELVNQGGKTHTGYSVLLLAPSGERTILTYRGTSAKFDLHPHDFQQIKPDWFYISSLSGDYDSLKAAIHYARKHHIKVAVNPGKGELAHGHAFKELLPDITVLSVNKEEAQMLFRGETTEDLAHHAAHHIPFVIVTDGPKGSVACDGKNLYKAGMYDNVPVVDRTGAGDAFNSGFVAMLAAGKPVEEAIVFASANSTSVVSKIGAKAGILTGKTPLHKMPLVIVPIPQKS
jgi:sugar/nucleoside kinase (ribokinase family)